MFTLGLLMCSEFPTFYLIVDVLSDNCPDVVAEHNSDKHADGLDGFFRSFIHNVYRFTCWTLLFSWRPVLPTNGSSEHSKGVSL